MMLAPALLAAALAAGTLAPVNAELLAGLPEQEAVLTAHGETHRCTGPALAAVLARLGLPAGEKLGGPALRLGLMIHARDGYAVLFSLGELDTTLGGRAAIIATACDGKALDDKNGPCCLILPGEQRPARSVRQLESIELLGELPVAAHSH